MLCFPIVSNLKSGKFLGKIRISEKSIYNFTDSLRRIIGVRAKNLEVTLLFIKFFKAFDSIYRGKLKQIIPILVSPKKLKAIIIFNKNMKAMVGSTDGDIDFFGIGAGCMQGGALVPYMLMICLDYILLMSVDLIKENGFTLKKKRGRTRRYPAETVTDEGYADDLALLLNAPAQAESLLQCLKYAARGIGLYLNANKTEFI